MKPDWIIGLSDTYFGILAEHIGMKFGIKSGIDAYDNFESYIPWFKPMHHYWRKAVSKATIVTAAGPHLSQFLNTFRPEKKVFVVPMAADPAGFEPMDRTECRQKLHLPLDKKLIGYCGSIYRNRGIDIIFKAFHHLRHQLPQMEMLLTGRKEKGIDLPPRVKWLGYLPDHQMPLVINSVNVLLAVNQLSNYGNFSYPVKLYEAMKCHIPIVATNTPPINWMLKGRTQFLSHPKNPVDLAQKIKSVLNLNRFDYGEQTSWEQSCNIFEKAILLKTGL
jgi:glycosyltransferase involved in cell wall biosynthesis